LEIAMGSVFKPKVTRPLPAGATLIVRGGQQWAEWRDAAGKLRRAPTTGGKAKRPGVRVEASTYTAKFRDGTGLLRKVATGCRSREAAKQVLAELEARAEKVRSGLLSARESEVAEHHNTPIDEHIDAYLTVLATSRGKGAHACVSKTHVQNVRRGLFEITRACGFVKLRDMTRRPVLEWAARCQRHLTSREQPTGRTRRHAKPPGPRTINAKLTALTAFGNWLVDAGRLIENPFERLEKLDESDDVRRKRRALTGDELHRLLRVARLRPLAERGRSTVRRQGPRLSPKGRATWTKAPLTLATIDAAAERARDVVRPDVADRLEVEGWERALTYEVMLTTGMRKGEVASLSVADLDLRDDAPSVTLHGVNAKNGRRCEIPLRPDVAGHLRDWVADRRRRLTALGEQLPADAPLFRVPSGLIRILDRDLIAAGIPKIDERGHRVDVHALRTTFNTQLAVAGVDPRTAMAAMRVSSLDLVLKTYADEKLLNVSKAVNSLPAPPSPKPMLEAVGSPTPADSVVPIVVPISGNRGCLEDSAGHSRPSGKKSARAKKAGNARDSRVFPAKEEKRAKGLEPSTSSLGS
jgi:integrase